MLQEPMMEKLTAIRLLGMVDALKAQEQDSAARELSFMERLGLLADQQWTWRENQALARRLHITKLKGAAVEDIDYRASRGLDKSVIRGLSQQSAWAAQHQHFRSWPNWCRKKLCRWRPGAESVPRWLLSTLYTRGRVIPRPRDRTRRWQSAQYVGAFEPRRCAGDRRLGHGSACRDRTPRLLGNL